MILQAAIVLAWVMGLTIAQFIPAPTDLTTAQGYADVSVRYKQVPAGICELDPSVKSYSGYADVAEDEHIFWWFFESRNQIPSEAPLTIWINGGPGSSSMIGLFSELGPCGVDFNGDVYNNPYSWSNASNMLFIDQPVTTGFSYSKAVPAYAQPGSNWVIGLPNATCPDYVLASGSGYCGTFSAANETLTANSTASAAPNFWKTLQGFMGAFPQYSRNSIYLTGESYAGHWIPIFAEYFETQNAAGAGHHIDLQAVMIGNPWMDPVVQSEAYYNFTVSPGNTYDVVMFDAQQTAEIFNNLWGPGNCIDITKACNQPGAWEELCNEGIDYCSYLVEYLFTRSWFVHPSLPIIASRRSLENQGESAILG
jgi:carboxypeptidase C (cathepsin A)